MHTFNSLLFIYFGVSVQGYFWIEEGGICSKRTGQRGICTHFNECDSAIREVRRNGRPEICSFVGIYPIVCCPSPNLLTRNQIPEEVGSKSNISYYIPFDENKISLKKCREYHQESDSNNRIYEKENAMLKDYPHIALLGYLYQNQIKWSCAGALISEEFVLTTAKCLLPKLADRIDYVRLGVLSVESTDSLSRHAQQFTVKKAYVHRNFRKSSAYDNIALVQLNKPVKFTEYIKPACLPITENLLGTLPEITGWGLKMAEQLHTRDTDYMKYVSNEDCTKARKSSRLLKDGVINTQICAINSVEKRRRCHFEQGSPLQITNFFYEFNNFPEIIGLASASRQCGLTPTVFTRVYPYVSWIESIVWPGQ